MKVNRWGKRAIILPTVLGLMLAMFLSVLFPKSAFADDAVVVFIPGSVIESQKTGALDATLKGCYEGSNAFHNNGNPTAQQISAGDWFGTGFNPNSSTVGGSPTTDFIKWQILGWPEDKTFYCDNFNTSGTTGTGFGLVNEANSRFGWGGMIQGACKIGLARQNGSDCINGDGNFKRVGYVSQATNLKPPFNSDAGAYVRYYLNATFGKNPNFVKVATASADTKAKGLDKVYIVAIEGAGGTATVVESYSTVGLDSGNKSFINAANAQAYANFLNQNPNLLKESNAANIGTGAGGTDTETDPCLANSEGLGWIICPGRTLLSQAINGIVGWITSGLQWTYLVSTGAANDTSAIIQSAWGRVLAVANIAFVIVFMILIYSTATSTGLSNYSIKKIMPRLIVVAITVNISFYICAAAADISNVGGVGIYGLISGLQTGGATNAGPGEMVKDIALSGAGAVALVVGSLLAWSSVLIGLIVIVAAIAMRSVILTMLVIIAPLAFVAALLPNTEKWWKKWRDTFIQLLMVYPAFMAVWAGAQLISNITSRTETWGWIISVIATVAPLFVIIPLFKASSGLMGKMTGLAQQGVGKAGGDRLKKLNTDQRGRWKGMTGDKFKNFGLNADGAEKSSNRLSRAVRNTARHGDNVKAGEAGRDATRQRALARHQIERAQNDESYAAMLGGGDAARGRAIVAGQSAKLTKEGRDNAALALEAHPGFHSFDKMLKRGTDTSLSQEERYAAMSRASQLAVPKDVSKLLNAVSNAAASNHPDHAQANDLLNLATGSSAYQKHPELGGATMAETIANRTFAGTAAQAKANFMAHQMSRLSDSISTEGLKSVDTQAIKDFSDSLSLGNNDAVRDARAEQLAFKDIMQANPDIDIGVARQQAQAQSGSYMAQAQTDLNDARTAFFDTVNSAASDPEVARGISVDRRGALDQAFIGMINPNPGSSPTKPINWP